MGSEVQNTDDLLGGMSPLDFCAHKAWMTRDEMYMKWLETEYVTPHKEILTQVGKNQKQINSTCTITKQKCNIEQWNIRSYGIERDLNNKIHAIIFAIWKSKFRIYISDYIEDFSQKQIPGVPQWEIVSSIRFWKMQKKVANDYSELKHKDYYHSFWKQWELTNFVKKVINLDSHQKLA